MEARISKLGQVLMYVGRGAEGGCFLRHCTAARVNKTVNSNVPRPDLKMLLFSLACGAKCANAQFCSNRQFCMKSQRFGKSHQHFIVVFFVEEISFERGVIFKMILLEIMVIFTQQRPEIVCFSFHCEEGATVEFREDSKLIIEGTTKIVSTVL